MARSLPAMAASAHQQHKEPGSPRCPALLHFALESPDGWAADIPKHLCDGWEDDDYAAIDDAAQEWARDMERRCNKAAEAYEIY